MQYITFEVDKKCRICGHAKPLQEFPIRNKKKSNLRRTECKSCIYKMHNKRNKLNPDFKRKERIRSKKRYDAGLLKRDKENNKRNKKKYYETHPEKIFAHHGSRTSSKIKGIENHHWSYQKQHLTDIIPLSKADHYKVHLFIKYDQSVFMYRVKDTNELLDTREKHENYIMQIKDS